MAALHYNENSGRKQVITMKGEKRYAVSYPKYKKGGHIVRKITEKCSYGKYSIYSIPCDVMPVVMIVHGRICNETLLSTLKGG